MQWINWEENTPLIILTTILSISIPILFTFWKYAKKKDEERKSSTIENSQLKDGNFGWIIPSKDLKFLNKVRFKEEVDNEMDDADHYGTTDEGMAEAKNAEHETAGSSSDDDDGESSKEEENRRPDEDENDENSPNLAAFSENLSTVGMDATMMDSLPGKMKKSKFVALNKKIEEGMTDDQKKEEAEVRRQQMEQIFRLMKEQEEKLGVVSPDDVAEQMKLYAL